MSLGAPTPIEVAVSGPNLAANREFAEKVKDKLQNIPTLRDVQFGQALDYPTVDVAVNRERAGIIGGKDGRSFAVACRSDLIEPLCRSELLGRSEQWCGLPNTSANPTDLHGLG